MIQFDEHIFQMGWNHQLDSGFYFVSSNLKTLEVVWLIQVVTKLYIPNFGGHQQNLEKVPSHVFTHHPKKGYL